MPGTPRRPIPPRPVTGAYGGTPLRLPLVTTIAATAVTATTANLNGSINPQGLPGTWWFAWGTTPQFGSTTASTAIGATSIPQTVGFKLTGLTAGTTYWFALVGSTAGGTVTSFPLSFLAQAPQSTTVNNPAVPAAGPTVSLPHFQFPFAFSAAQGATVVEQDTYGEILSAVRTVCACSVGACPELPTFGIPDLMFAQAPLNTAALSTAVQLWEPRATVDTTATAINNTNADWAVAVNASFQAPSNQ